MIRAARFHDLPALRELERAAGAAFRELGMHAVADDEPMSIAALAVFQQTRRAWVITDEADRPVAYLLADVVDCNAHVEQVSVHPLTLDRASGARCWTPPPRGPGSTTSQP